MDDSNNIINNDDSSNNLHAAPSGEEKKETANADDPRSFDSHHHPGGNDDEEEESEMRGVHAREYIPPNSVCMLIPRRCLITVEMGQATPIGQAISNSDLDLDAPKHIYLMVYLLWDRKINGRNSFFAPYYDILPKTLNNMPIFWTEPELAQLEGSYLLHQIADRNHAIAEDYHSICAIAPQLKHICSLQEFKWARMCVCSRNFGLQIDGHRTSALVPHADMLNHYRPRETKWTFDEERNGFTITTLQPIAAGAQVYDSYGQKCNHRFLLNYGFAVEENRELDGFCPNEVPLELFVDPDDPHFTEKVEFWTRGELHQQQQQQQHQSSISPLLPSGLVTQAILAQAAQAMQTAEIQARTKGDRSSSIRRTPPSITSAPKSEGTRVSSSSSSSHPTTNRNSQQQHNQRAFSHSHSMPLPHDHAQTISNAISSHLPPVAILKRVRVCVSNNENTRLLFSLLRTLACNGAELRAISTTLSSSTSHTPPGSVHEHMPRTIFGFSESFRHASQYSHVLTGTPSPQAYFRSCRDIRHPISLRNEKAAMRLLLDVVDRHLALYPTSLAQDLADLMDEQAYPRFSNKRHAKIQVRGEKEVLHHYALWARTALDVLDVIEAELAQEDERSSGSVEVQLTRSGKTITNVADESNLPSPSSFEMVIRRMESQCDEDPSGTHHTILRYCADILGSLRREESKNRKRIRAMRAREQVVPRGSSAGKPYNFM